MSDLDVAVVGGGAAGVAAAAAAARAGARTALIERGDRVGGTAINAVLATLCGLYQQADEPRWLSAGLPRWLGERLMDADGSRPLRMGPAWVLPFRHDSYQRLLESLLTGVQVITGRSLSEVGLQPRCWVDASGDGACGRLLGARWSQAPAADLQRPAVSAVVGPVPLAALGPMPVTRIRRAVEGAVRQGELPADALGLHVQPVPPSELLLKLNLEPPPGWSPADGADRRALLRVGADGIARILSYLAGRLEAFQHAGVRRAPSVLGVRESRRLVGDARLELAQVLGALEDEQTVALGSWPVERWLRVDRAELRAIDGARYGVPLGALKASGVPGLWMAGRCISASSEALASARVIGTCLETGEAAGTAAALGALGQPVTAAAVRGRAPWCP